MGRIDNTKDDVNKAGWKRKVVIEEKHPRLLGSGVQLWLCIYSTIPRNRPTLY